MIDKKHIEQILKSNGLAPTSKDEEIKSVLLSARYHEDEVDTAIMVLRENRDSHKTKVDGLHKVFRTDTTLNAKEITSLLGIDVTLDKERVPAGAKARKLTRLSQVMVVIISLLLALLSVLLYMYTLEMGVFHHTSAIAAPLLTK